MSKLKKKAIYNDDIFSSLIKKNGFKRDFIEIYSR